MYCSICGFENLHDVRYCNRCGKQLKAGLEKEKQSSDLITKFLTTIGSVTMVGIGLPIFAMLALGKRGFPPQILLFVFLAGLAATIALDGLLVWLMLRVMRMRQEETQGPPQDRITNGLSQPRLPMPTLFSSVTEHTTRNFEPVADRRGSETT